jgi:hypothetical protein
MSKIFASTDEVSTTKIGIGAYVTPWLTLKNSTHKESFEMFKINQSNVYVFLVLQFITTIYFVATGLSTLIYYPSTIATVMYVVSLTFPVFVGWVLYAVHMTKQCAGARRDETYLSGWICFLQSVWLLGFCVTICLQMAVVGYNGHCPHKYEAYQSLSCNYSSPHQMQEDFEIIACILPFCLTMIVRGARWGYVVLAYVISVFTMLFIMVYFDLTVSMGSFVLFNPLCVLVLYENQRQSLSLFLSAQNQENLLVEVERLAEETRASELRHLIGSVAQDLKTVRLKLRVVYSNV